MAKSNFGPILNSRKKAGPVVKTKATKRAARGVEVQESKTPVKSEKPLAKSKDPDFFQGNFYIRKTTHAQVKIKLLQEGQEKDLSDLVEELLNNWLSS